MRERAADVVLGMGRRREGESVSARRLAARGPEQAGQPEHTLHDRHRSLAERAVDDAAPALAPAPQLLRRDGGEVVESARAVGVDLPGRSSSPSPTHDPGLEHRAA